MARSRSLTVMAIRPMVESPNELVAFEGILAPSNLRQRVLAAIGLGQTSVGHRIETEVFASGPKCTSRPGWWAMLPRWQSVVLIRPISISAFGRCRLLMQS